MPDANLFAPRDLQAGRRTRIITVSWLRYVEDPEDPSSDRCREPEPEYIHARVKPYFGVTAYDTRVTSSHANYLRLYYLIIARMV